MLSITSAVAQRADRIMGRANAADLDPSAQEGLWLCQCDRGARPRDRRQGIHGAGRSLGLWEIHDAAHGRRPGGCFRRPDLDRRPRGERPRSQGPGHSDGVPGLRPLSPHECREEHVLRAASRPHAEGGDRCAGRPRGRDALDLTSARPQAGGALRRSAPTRRHGAGAGARRLRLPLRRAAVQP